MTKKPTMKEIARLAGVSRPSVSMILNNKPYSVTDETRERVLCIAEELNYRPNYVARSLKGGRTGSIGFVNCFDSYHSGNVHFYSQVVLGIEEALQETGSDNNLVMFASSLSASFEKSRVMIEQGAVDGLILNILARDLAPFTETVLPSLQRAGVPFVVIHSTAQRLGFPNVGLNTRLGGELAARYCLRRGYSGIGVHPSIIDSPRCTEPVEGFYTCMRSAGKEVTDLEKITGPSHPGARLLRGQMDAVLDAEIRCAFIPDDIVAFAFLEAAAAKGKRVPEDFALIGFDDLYAFPRPNHLTTIHHPFAEKGGAALRMLLRMLDGDYSKTSELVDPWLMERETA